MLLHLTIPIAQLFVAGTTNVADAAAGDWSWLYPTSGWLLPTTNTQHSHCRLWPFVSYFGIVFCKYKAQDHAWDKKQQKLQHSRCTGIFLFIHMRLYIFRITAWDELRISLKSTLRAVATQMYLAPIFQHQEVTPNDQSLVVTYTNWINSLSLVVASFHIGSARCLLTTFTTLYTIPT